MTLTQVDVEDKIVAVLDALEARTHDFEDLAAKAAIAEADYRYKRAMVTINVIDHSRGTKTTVDERAARVDTLTVMDLRAHLLAKATRDSCKESLASLREQLNALRTLAANIRVQV